MSMPTGPHHKIRLFLASFGMILSLGAMFVAFNGYVAAQSAGEKQQLAQLQTQATREINRRVDNLSALLPVIDELALSKDAQKRNLTKTVKAETTTLKNLKAKINTQTTLQPARADARRLSQEYPSYVLLVRKVRLLAAADAQRVLEAKFTTLSNKMQSRLSSASNEGKDISAAQTSLNDMRAHASTAKELSAEVSRLIATVEVGRYESNYSVLHSYYDKLDIAHKNLEAALSGSKVLLETIKKL